jgi:heavy-metal resistance protein
MRLPQIGLLPLTLVVSVGVNVFVAGWLVGDRAGRFGPPPPPPRSLQPFLDSLENRLSPEGAGIMDAMVRGFQDRGIRHFHKFEDLGERMEQALVGETFDRAGFLAAARELSDEQTAERSEVAEQIAGAIAKLSLEDRKRLAEMKAGRGFGGSILRLLPGAPFQGPRR